MPCTPSWGPSARCLRAAYWELQSRRGWSRLAPTLGRRLESHQPAFEFCREKRAWRPLGHAPRRTRRRVTLVTASRRSLIGPGRGGREGSGPPRLLRALAPVSRAGAERRAGRSGGSSAQRLRPPAGEGGEPGRRLRGPNARSSDLKRARRQAARG
ncbi:unnamed protein product [Pipistrellus nathusii]|uniref:Uncharacterized protein n=1 Tax=Pipistrellus nathusii TaxID=59473 RepID=A0ABN9ZQ89_PIPNA